MDKYTQPQEKSKINLIWRILDNILLSLQSIDPEDMCVKEYRSAVFQHIISLRPKEINMFIEETKVTPLQEGPKWVVHLDGVQQGTFLTEEDAKRFVSESENSNYQVSQLLLS